MSAHMIKKFGTACILCTLLTIQSNVSFADNSTEGTPPQPVVETSMETVSLSDLENKNKEYKNAEDIESFKQGVIKIEDPGVKGSSLQENSPNAANATTLTLQRACELAVGNHPLVASSRYSLLEKTAEYGMARQVYMPRIDFTAQAGPSHNLDTDTTSYGQSSVAMTQTFFNFGGLDDSVDSAKMKAVGAKYRLARTQEDIAALAINSYLSVMQAQETLQVYNNSLEFYNKLLKTFWERYNAGISSKADARKVEVSLRSTESQVTVQKQQLKTARLLLENIIKQPVNEVETDISMAKMEISETLEGAYEIAKANNVNLRAYDAEIESQKKAVSTVEANYYPSFGYRLQAKSEFKKYDGYENALDAQLTVNWNLFNGYATDEGVKREEAVLKRLQATKEATELEVQNILSDAFNAYKSSEKEFELARDAYDASINLMSLYLSEFDLGIRTLLDLITAREGQTSAAVREVNARYARIRAALNIFLEQGRLPEILGLPVEEVPFENSNSLYSAKGE
ncbi:TolC family protein [Maridesulfovibrio salexigens]|uniref:Outer membrane efflux protein n=1 Tax=Maridesulfovibrio salexigens (strain ATCC 14822 / DSM 2638 / NCIMB 8403 / VKM B-1763) TaxID=526222 RepID=C6BWI6_MARSD|nr:TolC family protein [Maridesulfovibrio salexigens]ACS80266.1 outer membrane efflux protein [Maridesulfovibrio salexigens DSM 2638]